MRLQDLRGPGRDADLNLCWSNDRAAFRLDLAAKGHLWQGAADKR